MRKRGIAPAVAALAAYMALLPACGQSAAAPDLDTGAFQAEVSAITVPDSVRVVGLGEASHGAGELQQLKAEVFKALVQNNGCRVFAIEGDFGGCAKVDEYIHGGAGTAAEAVGEIGFRIYRTQELADLAEWMRTYNESAAPGQDLHFLGFDMQRYDHSKARLLSFLQQAAPALAAAYEPKLAPLTDAAMYDLKEETLAGAEADLTALLAAMPTQITVRDGDYAFALQCAQSMLENTQLRRSSAQYNALRDAAMKKKVDWICAQYDGLIFINGHNGHIAKQSASNYDCMGAGLETAYAEGYFAIGTDVAACSFNGQNGDGYEVFTVKHEDALTAQLAALPENCYYLDFARVDGDPAWQEVLNAPQAMLALNVSFAPWQKLFQPMYTLSVVPQQSYDAMLLLKATTPTRLL